MAIKMRVHESKIVQDIFQEKMKACEGFGGDEIKDCEMKNMAALYHVHRK